MLHLDKFMGVMIHICFCFLFNVAFRKSLTDDPLAPLGPGGPYRHKYDQVINTGSDITHWL